MSNTASPYTVTAFAGERLLAAGPVIEVALAVRAAAAMNGDAALLVFDDRTGRQVDFDLSGSETDIRARLTPANEKPAPETASARRSPGRPKLGVVAREITLLPRHWEWLAEQPGGASVTLRRLVDAARGAGDVSFVAKDVDSFAGMGPYSTGDHAPGEAVDLASIPTQAKRAAILMSRLSAEARGKR